MRGGDACAAGQYGVGAGIGHMGPVQHECRRTQEADIDTHFSQQYREGEHSCSEVPHNTGTHTHTHTHAVSFRDKDFTSVFCVVLLVFLGFLSPFFSYFLLDHTAK